MLSSIILFSTSKKKEDREQCLLLIHEQPHFLTSTLRMKDERTFKLDVIGYREAWSTEVFSTLATALHYILDSENGENVPLKQKNMNQRQGSKETYVSTGSIGWFSLGTDSTKPSSRWFFHLLDHLWGKRRVTVRRDMALQDKDPVWSFQSQLQHGKMLHLLRFVFVIGSFSIELGNMPVLDCNSQNLPVSWSWNFAMLSEGVASPPPVWLEVVQKAKAV